MPEEVEAAATEAEQQAEEAPEIDATNQFMVGYQLNLVRPGIFPALTTKQQAYCFAAWVILQAELLPEDPKQPFSFEDYLNAVQR